MDGSALENVKDVVEADCVCDTVLEARSLKKLCELMDKRSTLMGRCFR